MRRCGFALATFLLVCGVWFFLPTGEPRPPNVLLVTIDTLRADRLGCYGYVSGDTPVSDRLAREGIVFERAFSPVPVTRPAHASLLTGLSPRRHGVRDNLNARLSENEASLAEILGEVGYQTLAVVSASPLVAASGLNQGFSRYEDRLGGQLQTGSVQTRLIERVARETTERAIALLEERDPDQPFFLWIHYFDPHAEYRAPEPFFSRFAENRYDGEVAYCESELARVFGYLRRSGEEDRTLVVYTSDHGEGLGDHGEESHGHFLFDSTLRVPLIIRLPGREGAGTRLQEKVSLLDVFSTVQSVVGIPQSQAGDGIDLAPLWREGKRGDRILFAESFYSLGHFGWSPLVSVRSKEYKLIRSLHGTRRALYQIENDPGELHNLMEERQLEENDLRAMKQLDATLEQALKGAGRGPARDRSTSKERRALVALQYTGLPMPSVASASSAPGDPVGFIRDFHRAMALAHTGSRPGHRNGAILAAARRTLVGLLQRDPKNPSLWMLLGQCAKVEKDYANAVESFRKALSLRPGSRLLSEAVGDALCLAERYGEALRFSRKALKVDSRHAGLWKIRAFGALRAGQYAEAVLSARECLEIGGEVYPSARCYLAAGLLGLEDLRGTLEALKSISDPRFAALVTDLREQVFQRARNCLQNRDSEPSTPARLEEAEWVLQHHFSDRRGVNEILQRKGFRD